MGIRAGAKLSPGAPSSNVIPGNPPPNGAIINNLAPENPVILGIIGPLSNLSQYGEILAAKIYLDIREVEDTSGQAGNCLINPGEIVAWNDGEDPTGEAITAGALPISDNDLWDIPDASGRTPGGLFLLTEDIKVKLLEGREVRIGIANASANFSGLLLREAQVGIIVLSR